MTCASRRVNARLPGVVDWTRRAIVRCGPLDQAMGAPATQGRPARNAQPIFVERSGFDIQHRIVIAEFEVGRLPWVQPWGPRSASAPLAMTRNAKPAAGRFSHRGSARLGRGERERQIVISRVSATGAASLCLAIQNPPRPSRQNSSCRTDGSASLRSRSKSLAEAYWF